MINNTFYEKHLKTSGNKSYFHGNLIFHKHWNETQLSWPVFYFRFCDTVQVRGTRSSHFLRLVFFILKQRSWRWRQKATRQQQEDSKISTLEILCCRLLSSWGLSCRLGEGILKHRRGGNPPAGRADARKQAGTWGKTGYTSFAHGGLSPYLRSAIHATF